MHAYSQSEPLPPKTRLPRRLCAVNRTHGPSSFLYFNTGRRHEAIFELKWRLFSYTLTQKLEVPQNMAHHLILQKSAHTTHVRFGYMSCLPVLPWQPGVLTTKDMCKQIIIITTIIINVTTTTITTIVCTEPIQITNIQHKCLRRRISWPGSHEW